METGKPGLVSAPVHINSVAAQAGKRMDIQAPLMAVYIPTVPALPAQPPAAAQEPATLHLTMPPLYSKDTLPFLTLHIAGGLQAQQGLSLAAASSAARPKSTGKHVCPHCGRDCMKPSVLEKHLRCHTGERPYPCTTCGISFKTQSNLYKHKRTQAHARLSSESSQSCQGSLESMSSSRETLSSSMSLDEHSEESGSLERDATLPAAEITCRHNTATVCSIKTHGSVSEQDELIPADHKSEEQNESAEVTKDGDKPPLAANRHLLLQRQEATLFSKQWKSSVTRGKSQNHESTDSGFSESSDHYPTPSSALPDHSMDPLTESMKERLKETINTPEAGQGGQEPKGTVREQEQKTLEERISKLISENTAVVEDKQLENVRPRKTVLSKQGSIDLPMPYTYKDSFHFDMRISKAPSVGLQRHRNPGLYSSVPTQQSTTMEHAPLTRSNSLPFSVTLLQPERSSPTSSCQNDYVTLIRRGSSSQINPAGFAIKPVNQQPSTHRPLVRQTAVDCNHATDGLYMNSSVEEVSTCSLSCDGDGTDISGEPSNRKFRRKKTQKFAYSKWYMYGGGTFKKLYNAEKGGDDCVNKGRKCSSNPEHEFVQGLQKRLSETHKETVATTASAVNFTSSSAIVCHPDCVPAKLSFVSAMDCNLKTTQLNPSCSSLKSPLRRNLSLSKLPVPLIGTLVGHKTESRADNHRGSNEQKHADSCSQLCGSQIPSDRKKQKTADQVICPLKTEADPNQLIHPLISVTSSTSQQATNISYINPQSIKHTQLKGNLFPPCIINANPPSVSTSPASSTPSATKTSFLPKYQLKLPNATEPDSNPSLHVVGKLTATDGHSFPSALSSSYTEQTQISTLTSCNIKKTAALPCTQSQPLFTCTASTLCPADTLNVNKSVTSIRDAVHRQFAAATITTTYRQDYQAGLCSTSVEPVGCAAPMHVPGTTATTVVNFPATPTVTTANNKTTNLTAFTQPNPDPSLPYTQISPTSDELSPVNRAYASSNTPVIPCQIVPFDQMQTNAHNVFHVHTADLQIWLQIISDEQLALIEPQIERQTGSSVLQRPDVEVEVVAPLMQRKPQRSDTMKSSNTGKDHQQPGHQTELNKSESVTTLHMERIKPLLSVVGKVESNPPLTEPSNSNQATVLAESKPPEALSLSQLPHKYVHVRMDSECHILSTATSLKGVKSGKSQTSEDEHILSLKRCAEEQLLPDRSVSQAGLGSALFSQNNLSMTSPISSTVNQNSTRRDTLGNESQHKLKNQESPCHVGATTARGEAFTYGSSKLEGGETNLPLQIETGQACAAACAEELSVTVPSYFINKYNVPRQLEPQASMYCSNLLESASTEALNSSSHTKMKCKIASPMDNFVLTQEMTLGESQDVSAPSQKQKDQFTSECPHIQVGGCKDMPAVPRTIHSPTAGINHLLIIFSVHIIYKLGKIYCFLPSKSEV